MSTNTKLAEALRRLIGASMVAMTDQELATGETLSAWEDANEALAAHDAEQAALRDLECPPDPEMVDRALAAADQLRAYALAARQQAQVPMCSEHAVAHAVNQARSESHKQGDAAFQQAFARAMWRQFNAMLAAAPQAQAAEQDERAAFGAWFQGYRHGWKSEKDVAFDAWQARAALAQRPDSAPAADWERELSAVMPQDFKDWWENSRSEWPAVAAEVIRSLRKDRDWWREAAGRAQRQPLTDEQIMMLGQRAMDKCFGTDAQHVYIAREVERAHGIEAAHGIAATTGEQR